MGLTPEGAYRCSECGHGDRLYACAEAIVSGRLLADGSVTEDDTTQVVLCESSIDCEEHPLPGHVLERWFGGTWTRWVPCMHTEPNARIPSEVEYRCVDGALTRYSQRLGPCPACNGKGGRWVPSQVQALCLRQEQSNG